MNVIEKFSLIEVKFVQYLNEWDTIVDSEILDLPSEYHSGSGF
jgi:hypothetical protein